jgi:hypothetical protein
MPFSYFVQTADLVYNAVLMIHMAFSEGDYSTDTIISLADKGLS